MPESSDLDVNRAVRRVFVKHWIDLGRVSVRCIQGRVLIRGMLRRIEGASSQNLIPPIVESIFAEIDRIREVRHLTVHLDNWANDGGRWQPFERSSADTDEGSTRDAGTHQIG